MERVYAWVDEGSTIIINHALIVSYARAGPAAGSLNPGRTITVFLHRGFISSSTVILSHGPIMDGWDSASHTHMSKCWTGTTSTATVRLLDYGYVPYRARMDASDLKAVACLDRF